MLATCGLLINCEGNKFWRNSAPLSTEEVTPSSSRGGPGLGRAPASLREDINAAFSALHPGVGTNRMSFKREISFIKVVFGISKRPLNILVME